MKDQVEQERSRYNEKVEREVEEACRRTEEAVKMLVKEEMNEKVVEMQLEFEKQVCYTCCLV